MGQKRVVKFLKLKTVYRNEFMFTLSVMRSQTTLGTNSFTGTSQSLLLFHLYLLTTRNRSSVLSVE